MTYGDFFALLCDLRGMGESNVLLDRLNQPTRRAISARAAAIYENRFADRDGRLRATFPGAVPHRLGAARNPAAPGAPRGSGQTILEDVFKS